MTDLIDVHSHFLIEEYVTEASRAGHRAPEGMPRWASWSAAEQLGLMDQTGVCTSMLSVSAPGVHFGNDQAAGLLARRCNEFGIGLVHSYPGRFGHFASLPLPDLGRALAELAYALDVLGSDGVAVLTNAGGIYLGDQRYAELYDELDRRAATVFVHPVSPPNWSAVGLGRPRPMLEYIFDSARAASELVFNQVLTSYPRINWVFSHSGGALPVLVERLQLFGELIGAAEPASVPEQLGRLWFDLAGTPFPNAAPALVRAFGDRRVLYGSDYCWTPAAGVLAQVAAIDAAPAPAGTSWRELTSANAARLLPGPVSRARQARCPEPGR